MDKKWLSYAGLVTVSAIWGANFGISRYAMDTFDPILFTFLRFGLAVPFFFLLLKLTEGSIGIPLKAALQLAAIGLVGITGLEIAVMYSIKYTTLANASLLNVAPWPIFAALFGPLFIREAISSRLVVGGIAALVGVCLIILGGEEGLNLGSDHMVGNLLALGVSMIGALYNVVCMPLMKQYSALRVSTWMILFGSLFMVPFTMGSWGKVAWTELGTDSYMAIMFNVLVSTVFAFVVWNASMYKIGATRANFFRYVVPASAMIAGYFWFDETIAGSQLVGALFMAAGLIWISMERRKVNAHPPLQELN
ncbi:drug/metabolite transporter (DMT)-like permease [Paenibacillus phyllosphaerae]|uniref:Drug/metabolite transporter (DMT)-like permease n=1 Tax=Paenibacillus phyllosphaerae TaxID=274593 RepID=A0A7W5AZS4_9BACL|nr:DMT family transporter [Paenibacillus phyllosphaerae]MBB3111647.1 drug/metabolite transporter (DMT)-like permease [Paenibacillus phyllosphaerae]